jgi:adenosylcobinamide kinase/adenosylcobinamide-phosphate guanylyltransferase
MRVFVSGGSKSGKSYFAQRLARAMAGAGGLYYVATMLPRDGEDDARVLRHRRERAGWGFTTVEQPVHIAELLDKCDPRASFLLDSLTALLANEMFAEGAVNADAADKICGELRAVLARADKFVLVSDYIYADAARYDPLTEAYRAALAQIDRAAAAACDAVLEVAASTVTIHKGAARLERAGLSPSKLSAPPPGQSTDSGEARA